VKEQVATSLHLLAALTGIPGFFILFTSIKAFGNRALSPAGRVAVTLCVLIGLGLFGFAIYLLTLSSNLPAK
jgi:hypothetical protein